MENRLQNLKIDDHGHDPPKDGAKMILPGHLNKLLEIFPSDQIVMIDLRSPSDYEHSHIHGAINFRAPASFVSRATMEMIEKALPDEASCSSFNKWYTSKCVVFYDKVVEYTWEAPAADALFQKLKSKGWTGQCFVLKGHYREFSSSFDKYIVGTNTTNNAKEYLASLQDVSWDKTVSPMSNASMNAILTIWQKDEQRYDDWLGLLEGEDRVYSTDLVPAVKAERIDATVKHQKEIEDEFEKNQPSLYREAMDRKPDGNWAIKAPMVPHLERGLAKMQEAGKGLGTGRSAPPPEFRRTVDKLSMSDYDLLESEDEHLSHDSASLQKVASAQPVSSSKLADEPVPERKGRSGLGGGRGFFGKIMRSGRSDPPR